MINRCYNKKDHNYIRYGAKGVKVCDRWHNFENFVNDIKYLPNYNLWNLYGGNIYDLDKDFLQQNIPVENRIYCPEGCCFLTGIFNSSIARDNFKFIGVIYNNNEFESIIKINDTDKFLGIYPTAELAAAAYNNAIFYYKLNYPLNPVNYIDPIELSKFRLDNGLLYELYDNLKSEE